MSTDKNQDQDFEYVSAAMDDDLSEEALARLLEDADAQQKWYEYHLIRDYLQHAKPVVGKDIKPVSKEAFTASLADVAAENKNRRTAKPVRVEHASNRAFRGFAVAASVLAVAVAAWQLLPQSGNADAVVAVEQVQQPAKADSAVMPVGGNAQGHAAPPAVSADKGVVMPNAAAANQPEAQMKPAIQVEKPADAVAAQPGAASAAQVVQ